MPRWPSARWGFWRSVHCCCCAVPKLPWGPRPNNRSYFFLALFFLRPPARFFGTLAPERRASDSPIAMACLRLFTFLPERPLRNVPFLRSRITFSTFFDAFLLYLRVAMRVLLGIVPTQQ